MLFAPIASLAALTLRVAVALLDAADDAASVAVPSEVVPARNVTVPVGAALPLAGVTVAVNWSVAVDGRLAGVAVTTVLVATGAPVTVTVAVPVELLNVPAPV
jgi:hypothetical protein